MLRDKKLLYFDTETTGLNEYIHDPYQIAIIIEINDEILYKQVFYAQPVNYEEISQKALDVGNMTIDIMKTYPLSRITYAQINHTLKKYVNPFDPNDKFIAIGHNIRFDMNMLNQWFKKHGNNYFYSMVNARNELDTLSITKLFSTIGLLTELKDNKLFTVCSHLGIKMTNAHDALCDITCTRLLFKRYLRVLEKYYELKIEDIQDEQPMNNTESV